MGRYRDRLIVTWHGSVDLRHLAKAVNKWNGRVELKPLIEMLTGDVSLERLRGAIKGEDGRVVLEGLIKDFVSPRRPGLDRLARAIHHWASAVGSLIKIDWGDVERRHVDMRKVVKESLALPVPKLGLKGVAQHFGIPSDPIKLRLKQWPLKEDPHRPSGTWIHIEGGGSLPILEIDPEGMPEITIADGRDAVRALLLYDHSKPTMSYGYRVSDDDRIAIREALKEYVRQDLKLTTEVTRHVVALLS